MSCVIGVKDAYKMQRVKAFVVLKPGVRARRSDCEQSHAGTTARKHIAKYAMP